MVGTRSVWQNLLPLLLVAATLPYFVNLGVSSIWDANEAFYAQTPREMLEADDYVTPSFNFQLRLNKPVLSYWEVAASYRLFGISERSERLPIAAGGIVLVAVAFGLARLMGGTTAGVIAGLALATSPRVLLLARRIIIDVHITMFLGLILLCFALAESRPKRRRLYLCLMYVAAGFGVLMKGPVAVFIPAVAFLIYFASQRRLRDIRDMMLPTGAVISLAIAAPWFYLVYREHGFEYIRAFILGENLGRYAEAVGVQSRGFLFYVPVMMADLFPWTLLLPVALWWAAREAASSRVARLLLIWIATIVVFFSLSATKEDLYILPIVPAVAALIGAMTGKAIDGDAIARPVRWFTIAMAIALFASGSAIVWFVSVAGRYQLDGAAAVGALAAVGGIGGLVTAFRRRLPAAVFTMAASLVLTSWCIVVCCLPAFERYKPVRPFADIIRARASAGAIVGSYRFALPSMVYYLNRPVMEVVLPDHLRAVFYASSDIYFVMAEAEYESIKTRLPVRTFVLARQQMFDLKPVNFLEGSELPQFVLVSNRE
ncbi:MAG: glycosyltransferase family 39 protein [Vicinamibacterales bacterium]|nr:glycosyltransferase family 39 protein [Vicinamibacterales bacterium]